MRLRLPMGSLRVRCLTHRAPPLRRQLSGPGEPAADFCVAGRSAHGVQGLVCLYGIESPGLTACLALGEHVAALVAQDA